ncbi:hypothetical protein DPMN_161221 [Dreissena polymorpha]|uniref:Uncharacterized protein n=1 Tax=Dreissena polymorpha TaxID=45954 RepID=A0A9D4EP99_DREPO|nr:hypothetical protein DPMN_161221 [Dreissena polymorpha]
MCSGQAHQITHPSQFEARRWRRWKASIISAAFWKTREELMHMSGPALVKHEQPFMSSRIFGDPAKLASPTRLGSSILS